MNAVANGVATIATILVLMAIVTTMMTGPLLPLFGIVGAQATRPVRGKVNRDIAMPNVPTLMKLDS